MTTPHSVTVNLRSDGCVLVQVYSRPKSQAWITDGLPELLENADDARAIGESVIAALHRSTVDVLPSRDLRAEPPAKPILDWAGVRSWAAYTRGMKSVGVYARFDSELSTVDITPKARERSGAFIPMDEGDREGVTVVTPEQLGRDIQAALKIATTS